MIRSIHPQLASRFHPLGHDQIAVFVNHPCHRLRRRASPPAARRRRRRRSGRRPGHRDHGGAADDSVHAELRRADRELAPGQHRRAGVGLSSTRSPTRKASW